MRVLRRGLLLSAFAIAALVPALHASSFSWNGSTICGGNSFATCAAVSVITSYNSSTGRTSVFMSVHNLSGQNGTFGSTVFTQIGIWNLPAGSKKNPGATYVNGSLQVLDQNNNDVTSNWQLGTNGLSGAGIQGGVFGADPKHGINGGIGAGDTFTFAFELTGLANNFDLNTAGFALHGQGGFQGCSTKLVIQSDGIPNSGPYDPNCTPQVTVPEPITMTLLATGLMGMGGVRFFRRRKQPIA